jgi:hypothetical protein
MPRKKYKTINANKRQYHYKKKIKYSKKYLTIDKKKDKANKYKFKPNKRTDSVNGDKDLEGITKTFEKLNCKENFIYPKTYSDLEDIGIETNQKLDNKLYGLDKVDVSDFNTKIIPEPVYNPDSNKYKPNEIILNKIKNKLNISIDKINLIFNSGGGDCWFKTISQAIYSDEKYHLNIRKKIYEHLKDKKEEFLKNSLIITRKNETILIYN